jgi:rhodanese-related sulfurtransferase
MKKLLAIFMVFFVVVGLPMTAHAEKADAPLTVEGATLVNNEEAKALFDEGVLFVDAREDAAWELGRISGALHLDVKTDAFSKEALLEEAALDDKVVFYCSGVKCGRSSAACTKAVEYGFTNVYYYREGFPGWKGAGYPVE